MPAITSAVPVASAAVKGSPRMIMAKMMVETGLMVPIIDTACAPTRLSAAVSMKDGSTVDVTAITAASKTARLGTAARSSRLLSAMKCRSTPAQAASAVMLVKMPAPIRVTSGRAHKL